MIDKDTVVETLIGQWAAIDALVSGLAPEQWAAQSPCPGWTVHDLIAHITGTELSLSGQLPPEPTSDVRGLPHVRNDIGALNETWVQAFRKLDPAALLDRFRAVTTERGRTLRAMSAEEFEAPAWTPAGHATYARFMRIRVFDCWMHEQDIRDAVGLPGGGGDAAETLAVDEIADALGYIVGKRGKAPDGSSITFDLTGPTPRRLHVMVDERAKVVDTLPGSATVTITLPTGVFARLCGGRIEPTQAGEAVDLEGDQELGRQIVAALAYTT